MKLSLITTCKGRLHHLKETLPANLKMAERHPNVEFVLVDYNSQDGMLEWAKAELEPYIKSGRLVYVHEKSAPYHSMGRSKNIALIMATGDVAANVDADNFISDSFIGTVLDAFSVGMRVILTGPQIQSSTGPRDGTYGRIAFPMEMFHRVRGYDEALEGWGYEEWDFLRRGIGAGYGHVKVGYDKIGAALDHSDEERYVKNFDPSIDRLFTGPINKRKIDARGPGHVVNAEGYGTAKVFVNFSKDHVRVGGNPHAGASNVGILSRGWKGSGRNLLATILDYRDRPNILMSKAWMTRARKHCPEWDITVMHHGEIDEIKEYAARLGGITLERYDITRNEIRKELCGQFGTNAQNYKIPFLRHVHDAKWPPFVFVDADAMICGDISDLADAVKDKPFVATTESKPEFMKGLRIVNSGVFAYRPESKLISYEAMLDEWNKLGRILKYPTGEQGILIPMFARLGYEWEHPKVGPEYNVFGAAAVFSGSGKDFRVSVAEKPGPEEIDWVARWVGWGLTKEPKIVHAISQFKWWNSAHLHPMWEKLVSEVIEVEGVR